MYAEKLILETDEHGFLKQKPHLPPNSTVEAIFLVFEKSTVHTFHGDGLKPDVNLSSSKELQDVLSKIKPLKRQAGLGRGNFWMSEDFDEPLSDDFWLGDE
jgi:hypothetical protein